jgi:hypothetical protein
MSLIGRLHVRGQHHLRGDRSRGRADRLGEGNFPATVVRLFLPRIALLLHARRSPASTLEAEPVQPFRDGACEGPLQIPTLGRAVDLPAVVVAADEYDPPADVANALKKP